MPFSTKVRRNREVRDIYNRLRQRYRADVTAAWLARNYFIGQNVLYYILRECDKEPVTNPSDLYKIAMSDGFQP